MRRRSARGDESAGVDLTPMLDIVFILLIFFIVTATFIKETGIDMTPPPTNEDDQDNKDAPDAILVQIDENNRIYINQEPTPVAQARVAGRLERIRADNPQGPVVIEPHPDAFHGVVVDVFDQAKQIAGQGVILQGRTN